MKNFKTIKTVYLISSLILLLIIVGLVALANNNNNDSNGNIDGTITPTPINLAQCEYNGIKYDSGQSFEVENGCSACTCSNGKVTCEEKEKMTKYTNSNFPDFSFEYDSCNLDIKENGDERNLFIQVSNDELNLIFALHPTPVGGGMPFCEKDIYKVITNNLVRVVVESSFLQDEYGEYLNISFSTYKQYKYYRDFILRDSEEFQEFNENFGKEPKAGNNICFQTNSGYHFLTKSLNYEPGSAELWIYMFENQDQQDINILNISDSIVSSMEY